MCQLENVRYCYNVSQCVDDEYNFLMDCSYNEIEMNELCRYIYENDKISINMDQLETFAHILRMREKAPLMPYSQIHFHGVFLNGRKMYVSCMTMKVFVCFVHVLICIYTD